MERRTALAAAGAVVLTVATGAVAVAANLGLMTGSPDAVGELTPVTAVVPGETPTPVEVETIFVDEVVPAPAAPAAPAVVVDDRGGPTARDDDEDDDAYDDEYEDDDTDDTDDGFEEEHEGRDDDD